MRVECLYQGWERWSWRATLLQSLAPTLKNPGEKIPNYILKTLITWFRCVWLGLELNSAGTRPSRINVPHPWFIYTTVQKFGVSKVFFFFFSKDALSLPKVTVKTFTLLQKKIYIIIYSFGLPILQISWKRNVSWFQNWWLDEMLSEQQINLLEWFLKDHVTLKTGEMSAENLALPSQN